MKDLNDTLLIMDDEPHILDWLVEYIESKNYKVEQVVNIGEAIEKLGKYKYRLVILDLNIPVSPEYYEKISSYGSIYQEYRGLYVAKFARTQGYRDKQVVVYSVHDSESVYEQCERMSVQYLIKGRPREFKRELDNILSYDPTQAN